MDKRPVGVFDSGLGGLTAVKQLRKILPDEDIVYFGDTGRVPYGTRSVEIIEKYARQDIDFLKSKDVKLIIAACGTVSAVALPGIKDLPVPIIGVVENSVLAAARATKNKKIGVIGTSATIRSGIYTKELQKTDQGLTVFEAACPLFVPLVENGFVDEKNEIAKLTAEHYLAPFKNQGVDTLILGCTHFPLLTGVISKFMGENVTLIDTGLEVARLAEKRLKELGLTSGGNKQPKSVFYVSDSITDFSHMAELIFEHDGDLDVHKVSVDSY